MSPTVTPLTDVVLDDPTLLETQTSEPDLPGMDADEVQAEISRLFESARSFTDTELSDRRKKASDYYRGKPFGNEREGRSQVVSTDLRDTVQGILPSMMRLFTGPDQVVAFRPNSAAKAPEAMQATEYVNFLFMVDNPGFQILYAALKDALVKGLGVIKWWWEEAEIEETYEMTGLSPEEIAELEADPRNEVEIVHQDEQGITIEVNRRANDGRVRVSALEPEDFIFSENAKSLDEALLVAHRTELRWSELVAMGVDEEFLEAHAGVSTDAETNPEKIARNPIGADDITADEGMRETQKVMYAENYTFMDVDGDGIAEHRRIITIGTGMAVWENEKFTGRPFAEFVPDPEPHTILGLDMFDYTNDVQRIKSGVLRASLDSLAFAVNPRTAVVETQVNMADIQKTEIGATIRVRQPGMIQELIQPYVGKEAFPMLEYMDDLLESRTGRTRAAAGLDADALQSSTASAVAATVAGSRQHLELLGRIFGEGGMTRLFKGLLRLVSQHQEKERMVELTGSEFVPVNPRPWDATMGVRVEVALGTDDERLKVLIDTAAKQEAILQQFGPENPMVTLAQYRNTLARIVEIGGFQAELFFQRVPADWKPPPAPPPPPTSEEAFLLAETLKAEVSLMETQMKLQNSMIETLLREDRERDRIEVDATIRILDIEAKNDVDLDQSMVKVIMDSSRSEIERSRTDAVVRGQEQQMRIAELTAQNKPTPSQP